MVVKPEIKRPLEVPMRRWKDNITIDFEGIRVRSVNWIVAVRDKKNCLAVLKMVMKCWVT
jgi:hypothetical protein